MAVGSSVWRVIDSLHHVEGNERADLLSTLSVLLSPMLLHSLFTIRSSCLISQCGRCSRSSVYFLFFSFLFTYLVFYDPIKASKISRLFFALSISLSLFASLWKSMKCWDVIDSHFYSSLLIRAKHIKKISNHFLWVFRVSVTMCQRRIESMSVSLRRSTMLIVDIMTN